MIQPDIDLLHPNKDDLLKKWEKELAEVAPLNKWDLPEELAWWAEYATRCNEILELGAYNGASTKIMLLANPDLKIVVIDLWEDEGTQHTFMEALDEFNVAGRLEAYHDTTENGLRQLLENRTEMFDGLLVDAGHTYDLVYSDIVLGMQLMKPGTLICGHDYHPPWPDNGVSQAVRALFADDQHSNPMGSIWAYQMPDPDKEAA